MGDSEITNYGAGSLERQLGELSGLVFHREGARARGVFVNELHKFTRID